MSFSGLFSQFGGYYALPVFTLLFGDAVWWRSRHRDADVRNGSLTTLLVPPILIIALGAAGTDSLRGWRWLAMRVLGVIELVLVVVFYRTRERRWPGAPVLFGAALAWTGFVLFIAAIAMSGDSL